MTGIRLPRRIPLRHFLHIPSFLPVIFWIIALSTVSSLTDYRVPTIVGWLVAHAVPLLIAGMVLVGLRQMLQKLGKKHVPTWGVFLAGALAGVIKATGTASLEVALSLGSGFSGPLIVRSIGGVIVGVWLVSVVAVGRTSLEKLGRARERLIQRNVAARLAEYPPDSRPEVDQSLHAVSELRDQLVSNSVSKPSEEIRRVVDSTIRPLSRTLWEVENQRYPDVRLISLYRLALSSLRLRAGLVAVVWAATSFTGLAVSRGVIDSAVYTSSVGSIALLLFSIIRFDRHANVYSSLLVTILGSVVAVLAGNQLAQMLLPRLADTIGPDLLIAGVAWLAFVVIGASMVAAGLDIRKVIAEDLASADTKGLIDRRSEASVSQLTTQQLATQLHGVVQSRLLSLAAELDQRQLPTKQVVNVLHDVITSMETLQSGGALEESTSRDPLADITQTWEGLMDVSVDAESLPILATLRQQHPELGELVREALVNAYRHGSARTVTISAALIGSDYVELVISDDGYGPRKGNPGLGSALLSKWTGGSWELVKNEPHGAKLIARLPFELATSLGG